MALIVIASSAVR